MHARRYSSKFYFALLWVMPWPLDSWAEPILNHSDLTCLSTSNYGHREYMAPAFGYQGSRQRYHNLGLPQPDSKSLFSKTTTPYYSNSKDLADTKYTTGSYCLPIKTNQNLMKELRLPYKVSNDETFTVASLQDGDDYLRIFYDRNAKEYFFHISSKKNDEEKNMVFDAKKALASCKEIKTTAKRTDLNAPDLKPDDRCHLRLTYSTSVIKDFDPSRGHDRTPFVLNIQTNYGDPIIIRGGHAENIQQKLTDGNIILPADLLPYQVPSSLVPRSTQRWPATAAEQPPAITTQ